MEQSTKEKPTDSRELAVGDTFEEEQLHLDETLSDSSKKAKSIENEKPSSCEHVNEETTPRFDAFHQLGQTPPGSFACKSSHVCIM